MNPQKELRLPPYEKPVIYLVVIYLIGVVGMLTESTKPLFIFLVPINILAAVALVLLYHQNWNKRFIVAISVVYIGGFMIEWLGVKTGLLFGMYQYDEGLGPKIGGVPPVMGLNWLLLVYGATIISSRLLKNRWLIASLGATIMLVYDLFLEDAAMRYHFWNWAEGLVPLRNYIGWWLGAFVFISILKLVARSLPKNQVAEAIFWLQLAFFACLYLGNNL